MGNERKLRLIQVAKEFKVSLNTITDFLQKKGIMSDGSPNTLVDADTYAVLEKEFGKKREAVGVRDSVREDISLKRTALVVGRKLRLIQVAKEFNVGLSTIVDFLQNRGIESDGSPNTKVDAETYAVLEKEFGKRREAVGVRDSVREDISLKRTTLVVERKSDSEVFISYSRNDTTVADRICAVFDRAGVSYFIDRRGVGGGQEFPNVLAQAIVDCKIVLFLASRNSYASKFTNGEIAFAFNKKKSILPFCIDDCEMPLGLQLMCSGINWRDMRVHPIETVLVNDILLMLGRAPQPTPRPAAAPLRARTYAVGDYYNENDKKGIIFEVDATGRHGKIMAMRDLPEELEWCTKEEYDKRVKIGVEDEKDGMKNLQIIRQIPGWWRKYPAFAGCAALGEGWYLPAKKELEKLGDNWKSLSEKAEYFGGEGLVKIRRWSSSEAHSKSAWFVLFGFGSGCMGVSNFKFYAYRVRAVAAF